MEFGLIINEILEVYNINASELADRIGVQRSNISHLLSGRNNPSVDFLMKLKAEFQELRWDYLIMGKKPMTEVEAKSITMAMKLIDKDNKESKIVNSAPTLFDSEEQEKKEEDEEKNEVDDQIELINTNSADKNNATARKITKIVWFYSDNTFEVFENK